MTTHSRLPIYVGASVFFLCLVFAWPVQAEESSSREKSLHSESRIPTLPIPMGGISMQVAQTVFPRPETPTKIWNFSNGAKAFVNLKEQNATLIAPNGDRKTYAKVQVAPSESLEKIAEFQGEEIYGRLEEMDYVDGSSDLFLSRELTATLDSSSRLVDISMAESLPKEFDFLAAKLDGFYQGKMSLTATLNLALTGDRRAAERCMKIIHAAKLLDLSRQSSDVRAQIIETLHRNEALLKSMGES